MPRHHDYLSRDLVRSFLPEMQNKKVSRKSRQEGFTKFYLAGGIPGRTLITRNQTWHDRRANFLKRHTAQKHRLFTKSGAPTRHHLSLIAWAYSPSAKIRNLDK